jgi:hypothetical protein
MRRYVSNFPRRLCASVLCLAAAGVLQAGEIYKSIDANGNVVYSDHLDPSLSQSTAVQLEDPEYPPSHLHFCWTNCFALILDHGVYHRTDGSDETWTVETFSANGMVLHRHDPPTDWNGNSPDVVYAGRVANDRLIDVTVNGKATSGIDASWGTALNTLPGSNAERDGKSTANLDPPSGDSVTSTVAPPPLPEEDQPPLPQDGSLWTPGYWYWRNQRYFWTPGAWMRPPQLGFLWTPGYWSSAGTAHVFHPGYWGPTVGFYGGVNYGYGYFGNGYTGGHWVGNSFAYNSAVNHMNSTIAHHTYTESVANQAARSVVGYSGAPRTGDSAQTSAQHKSTAAAIIQSPTSTSVERSSEAAPAPVKVNPAPTVAKTPAPAEPPKTTHKTPTQAAPVKQ